MSGSNITSVEPKDSRLQWIRSIAAIMVVLLHSASELMYSVSYGSSDWWFVNVINSCVRCAVPLFVMASGAVLLSRTDDFVYFYRKRAMRIAVPLVFWTIIYIAVSYFINHVSIANLAYLKTRIIATYNGKPYYHLWYLYMLIGLYLVTPFLQRLWAALSDGQKLFFTIMCFALSAIGPIEEAFLPVNSGSPAFFLFRFMPYVGYFVCGHYIKSLVNGEGTRKAKTPAIVALLAALAIITMAGSFYFGSKKTPGKYFFDYFSVNVIFFSILLFYLLMKAISMRQPPKLIKLLDKTSFGIYLIHPLMLIVIGKVYDMLQPHGLVFDAFIIGKATVAVAASCFLGWIMLKIPLLRKTV